MPIQTQRSSELLEDLIKSSTALVSYYLDELSELQNVQPANTEKINQSRLHLQLALESSDAYLDLAIALDGSLAWVTEREIYEKACKAVEIVT